MHDNCDDEHLDDFWWAVMVSRTFHPAQVQIIEALRRIDQPLSAAELVQVLDEEPTWPTVTYHLRRLARLDVIAPAENVTVRTALDMPYRLVQRPGGDDR